MARRSALVGALVLLGLLAAAGAAAEGQAPRIMPVSELRPGMKGYGITTLEGTELMRFDVEVVGVARGWSPKGDIILVRMSGPIIDEAGIIAGMSGSPVYVDDRLVGAVAYGWVYSKVPFAGLTPAEEMIAAQKLDEQPAPADQAGAKAAAARLMRARFGAFASRLLTEGTRPRDAAAWDEEVMRLALPPWAERRAARTAPFASALGVPGAAGLEPLPVPLTMSAATPGAERLSALLAGSGLMAVRATPAPADESPVEVQPGVAVGCAFVLGDMEIAGMGTLTYVDGDRAVAFGHPLLGGGNADLPLVLGYGQAVVPSLQRSFRLTGAGRVIGRITQDRDSAVVARLGERAPMFPLTVRIGGQAAQEYRYQVCGDWQNAALFALMAVEQSVARWQGEEPHTMDARVSIALKGRPEPVVLSDSFAAPTPAVAALELVAMPLSALLMNPYEQVEIESLSFEADVREGYDAAEIISARADRRTVEPGSAVAVYVRLQTWRGEQVVRRVEVPVPQTTEPGTDVRILVCDGLTSTSIDAGLDPGLYAPQSLDLLIEALKSMRSSRTLVVRAAFVDQGVRYLGRALPALPPSALGVLQLTGPGEAEPLVTDRVQTVEMPWVLSGSQIVEVEVVEPGALTAEP